MDEDWLDDTSNEAGPSRLQGSSKDPMVEQQWIRITSRYQDAGYREGITPGKLSTLQQGFDQAFEASSSPSRRLGLLRGKASSLLAYTQSLSSSSSNTNPDQISEIRSLIQALGRIKRTDILPPDKEALDHAKNEHGEEPEEMDDAMDEKTSDKRAMEGLEDLLGGLGGGGATKDAVKREGELLEEMEDRLQKLEAAILG